MAKKNVRDEPMKTQVTENDQLSDIVFILDKMELLLQAISEIDKNGRYKTVPADKEHRNSFLKIDRYASMFENFLKNFWSQFKDPTRFGLLTIKEDTLDSPEVRQAVEDIAAGRKSDAVDEFLKKYEIVLHLRNPFVLDGFRKHADHGTGRYGYGAEKNKTAGIQTV